MGIDPKLLYECLGQRIKDQRARLRMTQLEMARQINLSRTSVANIEAGHQNTPLHVIYDICLLLKLEPQKFFPTFDEIHSSPKEVANSIFQEMTLEGSDKAAKTLRKYAAGIRESNIGQNQDESRSVSDKPLEEG